MANYDNLDLNIIKEQISAFANISDSRLFILEEAVDFNPLLIRKKMKESAEALKLLRQGLTISFDGISNVSDLFIKADKNIMLTGIELRDVMVFHNHCARIRKILAGVDEDLSIRDYSDAIMLNEQVFDEVFRCIDSSGEIKEDASPELLKISRDLDRTEKDLYNKAHTFITRNAAILQEQSVYLRNDRITFLFKNSEKKRYPGYTYGTSASGLASYIEPEQFIELNNLKIKLMQDYQDEIDRILMRLSYLVAGVSDIYINDFESLKYLCVIFAKAQYGYKKNGMIADIIDGHYFDFRDLCHPLIPEDKVVSNSYRLYEPYQGIVISGSNTGGKTVSLKAIGLSLIMSYLGIPVIASKAAIPIYKDIYIDIDDNQSIQDSLSTFSAHISNINHILSAADENCLILIDELISGTDPKQAQAISLAIMDKIKEIGSIFIITTHFDDIKEYSYKDERILLSSVGFDMDELRPTYHYYEDSIGSSNALEIASRYFDDKGIITNARHYLDLNRTRQDEMLERLAKQISDVEKEKAILKDKIKENENIISDYRERLRTFESEKEQLKKKYLDELNEYIENIKDQALEKLESIKEKDETVIDKIEGLKSGEIQEEEEKVEFSIGDNVRIKDNEQIGVISGINKDNATVNLRGLTIKVKLDDLTLMPKTVKQKVQVKTGTYKRLSSEVNVVGERVEDALPIVEEYLDKAAAARMSQVKIIHGIGTGALRTAIRNRLKKLSYVKTFKDGDFYDGGSAVTMVEFR